MESELTWRKSSRSGSSGGSCVELAGAKDCVAVRDSKDPDGPVLLVPRPALRAALRGPAGR
ncbi:DUF397 domain-containing protein [Actinomadura sp. BRA 177]|uniref:DUF397 domain-containing protein n=1 Tax=Actinomadura sp. BRA 177 TaxID=2745202 RepID=UPI001594FE74|nr:DUF397 domain-containing protein [Actinomadura sp. BRA 177]NVI91070.1 DUF397 domain-containing protein [Actinomadura sp. BRA 177]